MTGEESLQNIISALEQEIAMLVAEVERLRETIAWTGSVNRTLLARHKEQTMEVSRLTGELFKANQWNQSHYDEVLWLTRERAEAVANAKEAERREHDNIDSYSAGYHEALDAVLKAQMIMHDDMGWHFDVVEVEDINELRSRYPRPARPEGEKQNTHGWPSDENEWAKGMQGAMRPEGEES